MLSNKPATFRQSGFRMPLLSRLRLWPVSEGPGGWLPLPPGPLLASTLIYNYNMLYHMGILADVTFIEGTRNRAYSDQEEAFASVQRMFGE